MNRTLAILLLSLSVLFTACQSDDPAIGEGGDGMNIGYIAVNIVQPSSAGFRADATPGFAYGSDDENHADKALFFLFKGVGDNAEVYQVSGSPYIEVSLSGSGTGTSPEVERIYDTVLVIDGATENPSNEVKSLVCVLNAPAELKSANISKISDLKALIGKYGNEKGTKGSFIMSSSVYTADGNITTSASKEVNGAQVSLVKNSSEEAKEDPINIYVERVVAKVKATFDAQFNANNSGAKPEIDGEKTTLGINITGVTVANIAEKSYLFKSVAGAASATTGVWKEALVFDSTNKRSYWETVPTVSGDSPQMTLENKTYTDIAGETLSDIVNTWTANPFYIQPNTADDVENEPTKKTCILVTAQLTKDGEAFNDLAYIRGGYTTINNAKNVVAAYLATKGYYKNIANTGEAIHLSTLSTDDLVWKNKYDFDAATQASLSWLKDYEVVAQVDGTKVSTLYNADGNVIADGVTEVNEHLRGKTTIAKNYRARVFNNGMCYYYKEIDHSSVLGKNAGTYYGVVRNHIYDLTLESIKGIGTPVYDPSDKIIPQTPKDEEKFYLGAKVNVLAWKVATQKVNFEGK